MFEDYMLMDLETARKNVRSQGTKVLQEIAQAYNDGTFDNPSSAVIFCSLLACICEGKVRGTIDEDNPKVKWSLTEEYSRELEELRAAALQRATTSGQVVKGPWT